MKLKKTLLFTFLISSILSCTNEKKEKTYNVQIPEESISLSGSAVPFFGEMFRPAKLYISNNKLVVFDDVQKDLFKVFNLPDLNYCYAFSSKGGGPDEFQMIDKESINIIDGNFEIFYRNKLYRYQIGDSKFTLLKNDDSDLVLTSISPVNNFRHLYDNVYVFNNDLKSGKEFSVINTKEKEESAFGELKPTDDPELKDNPNAFYSKALCSNKQKKRFAAFYYHRPSFSLYDKKGKLLKTVSISPEQYSFNPHIMYFVEPYATDKYIYAMWVFMDKKNVEQDFNAFRPEIFVFDWDGNFVKRIKLDKPIITFAVSEKNNELYAVSFMEDDLNKVYKFKL